MCAVEPLIKDTLNKEHHNTIEKLVIKDTFKVPNVHFPNRLVHL